MLMASLKTAVKDVDVTDPIEWEPQAHPLAIRPHLIGGSKRKTEQSCAFGLCQASRGHCGAVTLKLNVLSTNTLQFTPPKHTIASLTGFWGHKQAKWEST